MSKGKQCGMAMYMRAPCGRRHTSDAQLSLPPLLMLVSAARVQVFADDQSPNETTCAHMMKHAVCFSTMVGCAGTPLDDKRLTGNRGARCGPSPPLLSILPPTPIVFSPLSPRPSSSPYLYFLLSLPVVFSLPSNPFSPLPSPPLRSAPHVAALLIFILSPPLFILEFLLSPSLLSAPIPYAPFSALFCHCLPPSVQLPFSMYPDSIHPAIHLLAVIAAYRRLKSELSPPLSARISPHTPVLPPTPPPFHRPRSSLDSCGASGIRPAVKECADR